MATLQQQLKRAKKIQPNKLEKDLYKFVRSIEKEIVNLEKKRISEDSEDIFGKPIGFYSKATDAITDGKKEWGTPFTGIDTGDWFKGFYMQEVSGVLRFMSKDPKTQLILNSKHWLSDKLFGLSNKDLKKVIAEKLLPFFIKNSRELLGI